jgi:hypothetical protein
VEWADISTKVVNKNGVVSTRQEILRLIIALAIGKAIVLLAVFLYSRSPDFLYLMSTQWDSYNFQRIAVDGYVNIRLYAFSPFYPYLIKGLALIIPSAWICGLIVTNAFSFAFPLVLYKTFGYKTALLAELFPIYLVFTTIPYSDVISLFFLALSLFLILREKIIAPSVAVSLAIFNSFNLAWTLPSYLVHLLKQKRIRNLLFYVVPGVTGLLILVYYNIRLGDYWKFFAIEKIVWDVQFSNPVSQIAWLLHVGEKWFSQPAYNIFSVNLATGFWLIRNMLFEVFYIFGAIYLFKTKNKNRVFLGVYSLVAIIPLLCVTGTPVLSIPRLLLTAFPVFFGYSILMKKDIHYLIYSAVCLILAAFIAIIHTYSFFG